MTEIRLRNLVDLALSPLNLILRRKSTWEALCRQLKRTQDELEQIRRSQEKPAHVHQPQTQNYHAEQLAALWNNLAEKSKLGFISHLEKGSEWNLDEFGLVGARFVDRMVQRFKAYGCKPLEESTVCEIGCGVGRFLKPLASHFRFVIGVDISQRMLETARQYCSDIDNIRLVLNDGMSMAELDDDSVDYCVSAGVFQHITDFRIITGYIADALRITRPDGIFLFQFEGNRTEPEGHGQVGARITAKGLDEALQDIEYEICEVSQDSKDPVRNIVIVLKKPTEGQNRVPGRRSFVEVEMIDSPWLSGVYDGIRTKTRMQTRLEEEQAKCTFYEDR
jgi:SAM-dependent methyltransferase